MAIAATLFLTPQVCLAEVPEIISIIRSDTINSFFGSRIIPAGEQSGDMYDDFWVFEVRGGVGTFHFFLGGNPPSSTPSLTIHNLNSNGSNIGDVNNDGWDDFIFQTHVGFSLGKLKLYFGGPLLDTIPDAVFGLDAELPLGVAVNGNDLNSNGFTEILTPSISYDHVEVFELGPVLDSVPDLLIRPTNAQIPGYQFAAGLFAGIASGDYNGDDTPDVAISVFEDPQYNRNGKVNIYWGGNNFDTLHDFVLRRPGPDTSDFYRFSGELTNVGDMNGDGFDDLYISSGNSVDTIGFIYFCGPLLDTVPDATLPLTTEYSASAGDVNGDGRQDLMTSLPLFSSGFGYVAIYYGAEIMTGEPDIRINVWELPEYAVYFGQRIAGIGDVNGDDIDDYAAGAVDNNNRGVVYLFAGDAEGTPVGEDQPPILPAAIQLSQNYPNPFNLSTTISFALPKRSEVTLTIVNLLGQQVRQIVQGSFAAGQHKAVWDGQDDHGEVVSSGVYYYKLEVNETVTTRKMILVK